MAENGNGNGLPKWERIIPILTFIFVIVGGIWFGGGEWRWMKENLTNLTQDVASVQTDLDAMKRQIQAIESDHLRRETEASERERTTRRTPVFGPSDSSIR